MNAEISVKAKFVFYNIYPYSIVSFMYFLRSPLRDMVVGRKIFFKCFAFSRKTFKFSHKDICVPSQNELSSDKHFLFTLQLAVVHTAPHVHNGEVHRVLF